MGRLIVFLLLVVGFVLVYFVFFTPLHKMKGKASFIQSAVFKEWETIQCVIVKV